MFDATNERVGILIYNCAHIYNGHSNSMINYIYIFKSQQQPTMSQTKPSKHVGVGFGSGHVTMNIAEAASYQENISKDHR